MSIGKTISSILLVKSFVFGSLILVVWVRSYFVADMLEARVGETSASLSSASGVIVYRAIATGSNEVDLRQMTREYRSEEPQSVLASLPADRTLGFSYHTQPLRASGAGLELTLTIPLWLFFLLGSSTAIIWSARRYFHHLAAPPEQFSWCVRCQCEQTRAASQCAECGSPVAI